MRASRHRTSTIQTSDQRHSGIEPANKDQFAAWLGKKRPDVEEIRNGVWSIPVPTPVNSPRYTLVYALATEQGLVLIDAGWDDDAAWNALRGGIREIGFSIDDVAVVLVTHMHRDHFGLAPRLKRTAGALVGMHCADADEVGYREPEEIAQWERDENQNIADLGAPSRIVAEPEMVKPLRFEKGERVDVRIGTGDEFTWGGVALKPFWTPGHTVGHMCFVSDRHEIAFTGDHVLPRISPNIAANSPTSDPLGTYLDSLRRVAELDADIEACPAHEYRFWGLRQRARDLVDHHWYRLNEIEGLVARHAGTETWEIAARCRWSRPFSDLPPALARMAVREIYAHLLTLARDGRVICSNTTPYRWISA